MHYSNMSMEDREAFLVKKHRKQTHKVSLTRLFCSSRNRRNCPMETKDRKKISGKIILENLLRDVLRWLFELILVVADFAHDPAVFDRVIQHDHYLNRLAIDGWHLQHIVKKCFAIGTHQEPSSFENSY